MKEMWSSLRTRIHDLLFFLGFGIVLHAIANELYYKGGYLEILRPQGEYIGLALMFTAYLTVKKNIKINRWFNKHRRDIIAVLLFMAGAWQLDLLIAPALWDLEDFLEHYNEPFLLPFNIPIHKQIAYCLFFTLMVAGFLLALFNEEHRKLFKNGIKKLLKR